MLLMGLFVWTFLRIWSLHYKVGTGFQSVPSGCRYTVGTARLMSCLVLSESRLWGVVWRRPACPCS